MDEKKKLIEMILDILDNTDYSCEICTKMGFNCPVHIPDDYDFSLPVEPDFGKCNFKEQVYKTLTIED